MLQHLVNLLFKPPPISGVDLPWITRVLPGVKQSLYQAFELTYYRGVYDGLIAGVLLTLLFVPSLRGRVSKGVSSAVDAIDG